MELRGRSVETGRPVAVQMRGDKIVDVLAVDRCPDGMWVAPGLIDLQVNGFAGHDFNSIDPSADAAASAVRALAARGTTSVLPTLITASRADLLARLNAIVEAVQRFDDVRSSVLGVHIEGPFISAEEGARGVHDPAAVRPPDLAELERWLQLLGHLRLVITVAPEVEGIAALIRAAVRQNVIVSIGHSAAEPSQVRVAVAAGASMSTHLGNGVAARLSRHPNLIWEQLAADELSAGFIADGFHLDGSTLRAMVHAKGWDRSMLVSDATAVAGLPPGRYRTSVGTDVELERSGRLHPVGQDHLAGAAVDLAGGAARLPGLIGASLRESFWLAARNPGRLLADVARLRRGLLEPGCRADIIRFTWSPGQCDLQISDVIIGGRRVDRQRP